jgi:hypothetical protein
MTEPLETSDKRTNAIEIGAMVLLIIVFLTVSLIFQNPFAEKANPAETFAFRAKTVGIIVAAGLTLIMYSFLYRDNPLFKIAENLYVGVTLGYGAIMTWRQALRPEVFEPFYNAPSSGAFLNEVLHRSVPILLGILLLTRLSRKYGWLSRYSYVAMIGWGSGMAIPLTTHSFILAQLYAGVAPFQETATAVAPDAGLWAWCVGVALPIFGAILLLVGTVAVLFYFFFSVEHKRGGKVASQIGVLFLMVSFGASFGYTVMGRVSLLIGRVQFLLFEWLKISK